MEFSYKRSYIYNTFINNWTYDTQEVILSRSNFNNLSLISNVVLSHGWKSFLIPGLKPMSAGIFRVFFLRGGESSRTSKSNCVLCLPLGETFRELFSRKLALTKGLSFLRDLRNQAVETMKRARVKCTLMPTSIEKFSNNAFKSLLLNPWRSNQFQSLSKNYFFPTNESYNYYLDKNAILLLFRRVLYIVVQ